MNGLKRLSGAKDVSQDDFQAGVATFIVTFDAQPKVKMADIKKEVGKYVLKEVAGLKGKKVVLSGVLTEDDAGAQTLTLSKVAEAK